MLTSHTSDNEPHAIQESNSRPHYAALDGLRGIAILTVMLYHFVQGMQIATPIDKAVYYTARAGWIGVDLFFVCSGFLITGILLDLKGQPNYFYRFFLRRTVRIFPLYYGTLFVLFIAWPAITGSSNEQLDRARPFAWWYWLYGTNWLFAIRKEWLAYAHLWSLAVEEQFYIIWPFVVYFTSQRRVHSICLACMLIALTCRLLLSWSGAPSIVIYPITISRMDSLAAGAIIAVLARSGRGLSQLVPSARKAALLSGAILTATFLIQKGLWRSPFVITIGCTLLAVLFGAIVIIAVADRSDSSIVRLLSHRWLTFFGKYSYGLYMIHPFVQDTLADLDLDASLPRFAGSQIPGRMVFIALCFVGTTLAALASWHLYEKHWLKLKRYS